MTDPLSPGDSTEKPLIILVSSGYHLYREYLLDLVAGAAQVWLFLTQEPTWEKRYIAGFTVVDTLDVPAMLAAARELSTDRTVSGVLCWDEVRMVQTAELQQALGLPGTPPEAVGRCRDKHQTRAALAAAGVPQATSVLVSSLEEAAAAAAGIGYPVILKPRALGASFGVNAVADAEGLAAGYAEARGAEEDGVPYFDAGVLVEEYLTGEEISVDAALVDGELLPLFVARKISGFDPYFEEIGHTVDAGDPLLTDPRLLDVLTRAHRATGYHTGITHTELRLTADGPEVIEINARLGGDLIPYVGSVATGVDPGRVAVEVATGRRPDTAQTRDKVAAIHFLYPEADGTVAEVLADEAALAEVVTAHGVLAGPGQELLLPPAGHVTSRYGYLVVEGDTAADCERAAEAARRAVTVRMR
ncbi:ATP-grasp domain-containing protein [Kitasatospora sp. MMS16-BH015]|uniref:ATP-grasp domain-containing protein n=1 Tax=Kitasatospora sp. MMS16-BH015 TaxID=2018025 RepID=UPI000CA3F306|nr:ATP-grasp domain-containing protein [Kitasatospora sp. MMS16-BH015]AUG77906.1 ATP-grasp domain-containing protein [Kitasatospora sp. MMS16-BH015]